jgi:uncharacterized protein YggE
MNRIFTALLLAAAMPAVPATAQTTGQVTQAITGTRLDLSANGEVTRVPDLAIISAGVVARAPTAAAALQETADKMDKVIAALKRAGVADRDIQTSSVNLNPEYRYPENQSPQLVGYSASNQVTVRFRDIRNSGKILDALVAEGANQISGPSMTIEHPEAALDEARVQAIANGRARATLYARALGMQVVRVVSVSEGGGYYAPPPAPPAPMMAAAERSYPKIEPGEKKLQVSVSLVFELRYTKRPRGLPRGLPVIRVLRLLANRAPADEVHDREQDNCAEQRPKEGLDRQTSIDVTFTEQQPGDHRADDADDDIEDDPLLRVRPHDKAGEPTNDASDNQPNDETHESSLLFAAATCTRRPRATDRRPMQECCSGLERICPDEGLTSAEVSHRFLRLGKGQ